MPNCKTHKSMREEMIFYLIGQRIKHSCNSCLENFLPFKSAQLCLPGAQVHQQTSYLFVLYLVLLLFQTVYKNVYINIDILLITLVTFSFSFVSEISKAQSKSLPIQNWSFNHRAREDQVITEYFTRFCASGIVSKWISQSNFFSEFQRMISENGEYTREIRRIQRRNSDNPRSLLFMLKVRSNWLVSRLQIPIIL